MAQQEMDVSGSGSPLPIKLSRIERFEGQSRRFFDSKAIEKLADSIESEEQKTLYASVDMRSQRHRSFYRTDCTGRAHSSRKYPSSASCTQGVSR
jgi:hypothetical protein